MAACIGAGKTYTLFGNKHQEGLAQYMILGTGSVASFDEDQPIDQFGWVSMSSTFGTAWYIYIYVNRYTTFLNLSWHCVWIPVPLLRIREVFARLGDQEGEVSEHPKVTVCGSALASWMWWVEWRWVVGSR